jgi:hypothetical protein
MTNPNDNPLATSTSSSTNPAAAAAAAARQNAAASTASSVPPPAASEHKKRKGSADNTGRSSKKQKKKQNQATGKRVASIDDKRLASVREMLESQPESIRQSIADSAVKLLDATLAIESKRRGVLNLETADDLFPKNINFKPEFAPHYGVLLDGKDEKTMQNLKEFEDTTLEMKKRLKKIIIKQRHREIDHAIDLRMELFVRQIAEMADLLSTYHCARTQVKLAPHLTDATVGAAACYCYYSDQPGSQELFTYLAKTQKEVLTELMLKRMTDEKGAPVLRPSQFYPETEQRIGNDPSRPLTQNPYDDSSPIFEPEAWKTSPTEARQEEEKEDETRNRSNDRGADEAESPEKLSDVEINIIQQVKIDLWFIVKAISFELTETVGTVSLEKLANRKVRAKMRTKDALDLADNVGKALQNETPVSSENMVSLIDSRIDVKHAAKEKALKKELAKTTRKNAQGNGRAQQQQKNGKNQKAKGQNKNNKKAPPPNNKKAKRQNWQPGDYQQWQQQQRNPYNHPVTGTVYALPPPPPPVMYPPPPPPPPAGGWQQQSWQPQGGRGRGTGRGRGRGRGRGGSNRGRGGGRWA